MPTSGEQEPRQRLLSAMIAVAADYGYAGSSVERVAGRAGLSRATFYAHFRDREDCFVQAFRGAAEGMRERVGAESAASEERERPRAVLAAALAAVSADPAAARIVLLEALGGGPAVRKEHEALVAAVEGSIASYLEGIVAGPNRESALEIPAAALLGGLAGVVSTRLVDGDRRFDEALLTDLTAWVDAYALPSGQAPWPRPRWEELRRAAAQLREPGPQAEADRPMPRGRHALDPSQAGAVRQQRILASIARLTRATGYAGLTVADITREAGVSRGAFYTHFRSKEDAFLAAQMGALRESMAATASEFSISPSWPERVWLAALGLFRYMDQNPDLSHLELLEVPAAGAPAVLRQYDARKAFEIFLEEAYRETPRGPALPRLCSEAIGGAIYALMRRHALAGRVGAMVELLPQSAYVVLAPFIGPLSALDFIEAQL